MYSDLSVPNQLKNLYYVHFFGIIERQSDWKTCFLNFFFRKYFFYRMYEFEKIWAQFRRFYWLFFFWNTSVMASTYTMNKRVDRDSEEILFRAE